MERPTDPLALWVGSWQPEEASEPDPRTPRRRPEEEQRSDRTARPDHET